MGWDRSFTFLPYGDKQRKHTRLMHEGLNPIALQTQRQLQEYEVVVLVRELASTPTAFCSHIRRWVFCNIFDHLLECISERFIRYTASLILHLASGHRVYSTNDKYVQISETAVTGLAECGNPGSQVVDLFPARKFFVFFYGFILFKAPSCSVKYIPAWLPGMAFKRHALKARKDVEEMENMLFDVAKSHMVGLAQCDIH